MTRISPIRNVTGIISMLHEPPEVNSATRRFRQSSVLEWTLHRMTQSQGLESMAILCWEDQLEAVRPVADEASAYILAKGPRQGLPRMDAIAAAQRWADGWRGGLLNTCHFDQGFHAAWVGEIMQSLKADAAVLVDPASALVDPALIDNLIERSRSHESLEMIFSPAAPGLSGVLIRPALLERLCKTGLHPGKLLHYLPDAPAHDPCSGESCAPPPTPVARTLHRFKFDSQRQIERLSRATLSLNGQLIHSAAESLVFRMDAVSMRDAMPREVVLELNLGRKTRPIHLPSREQIQDRPPMTGSQLDALLGELGQCDDIRLTLGGVGDPLLSGSCLDIIQSARRYGVNAVHVQTDLLGVSGEIIDGLATSDADVVSVNIPAVTGTTYQAIMGVDGLAQVMENIRRFVETRAHHQRMTPILTPTFVKCRANLGEMEVWYDQWLRALGAAVIVGPRNFGGLIEDQSVADMSSPTGRACGRIGQSMTILCDGRVVPCEEDVLGGYSVGCVGETSIRDLWHQSFDSFQADNT